MERIILSLAFIVAVVAFVAATDNEQLLPRPLVELRSTSCEYGESHTLCLPEIGSNCGEEYINGPVTTAQKENILKIHNELRAKVASGNADLPKAGNMMKLAWNDDLAEVAQRWASQCSSGHDKNRNVTEFPKVGQNVYASWSSRKFTEPVIGRAINNWYDEIGNFNAADTGYFDPSNANGVIGHFTQVVWAKTTHVGCGWSIFKSGKWWKNIIVCNYGPAGNFLRQPIYEEAEPCSLCPTGSSCIDGSLCA